MVYCTRQPISNDFALPRASSERRSYTPIAFASSGLIAGDKLHTISNATPLTFVCITSTMLMAWMHTATERLIRDFLYSAKITYNNIPLPVIANQSETLPKQSSTPSHGLSRQDGPRNDKHVIAIENASQTDAARVAFLFERHQTITSLLPVDKPKRKPIQAKLGLNDVSS